MTLIYQMFVESQALLFQVIFASAQWLQLSDWNIQGGSTTCAPPTDGNDADHWNGSVVSADFCISPTIVEPNGSLIFQGRLVVCLVAHKKWWTVRESNPPTQWLYQ